MALQIPKAAVLSRTMRFLTAGGLTLLIAVVQEITKTDTDWTLVATMLAGIVVGIGGGAYGRCVAQGPVTGLLTGASKGGAQ